MENYANVTVTVKSYSKPLLFVRLTSSVRVSSLAVDHTLRRRKDHAHHVSY